MLSEWCFYLYRKQLLCILRARQNRLATFANARNFHENKKKEERKQKKAKLPLHYTELNKQLNMNGIFEMPTRTLLK